MTILLAGSAALLLMVGCEAEPKQSRGDDGASADLFDARQPRSIHALAAAQARAGAREDATLQEAHFDGAELNSLGRAKLDLMIAGREDRSGTIYMNFGENDGMERRRDSVVAYLGSMGIAEGSVKFISGTNPSTYNPAGAHLSRIERTESGGLPGGAGGAAPAPADAPAATGGGFGASGMK